MYKFAEIKYGKIASIHEHAVPLEEFKNFFDANALFIDITGIKVEGEDPAVGDIVTTGTDGYKIEHFKHVMSPAEYKAYIVEKMKLIRNQKELEPIEYNRVLFDADKDAITRMDMASKAMAVNDIETIVWTAFNNEHIQLSVDDFNKINAALMMRAIMLHDHYNKIKSYVYSLEDTSVLDNFTWDTDIN